jgi:hypothetical protein
MSEEAEAQAWLRRVEDAVFANTGIRCTMEIRFDAWCDLIIRSWHARSIAANPFSGAAWLP